MKSLHRFAWVVPAAFAIGCGSGGGDTPPPNDLPAPAPDVGFQLALDVASPAHSETWTCVVRDLPIDGPFAAHGVEHDVNTSVHHLTVSLPVSVFVSLEDGTYDCNKLYAQYPQLMEATAIYGGQGSHAQVTLPDGVAAQLPGALKVLYEVHHVNPSSKDVDVRARINVYSMPADKVKQGIWATSLRNEKLDLPPRSEKTEVSRCVLNKDVDVLLIATHTHARGKSAQVHTFDGKVTGPEVYRNDDWSQPLLNQFTTPLHVAAGQGFELRCQYMNTTDRKITYGLTSEDEMCNLNLIFTPDDSSVKCTAVP